MFSECLNLSLSDILGNIFVSTGRKTFLKTLMGV